MDILEGLNEQQKEAVTMAEGLFGEMSNIEKSTHKHMEKTVDIALRAETIRESVRSNTENLEAVLESLVMILEYQTTQDTLKEAISDVEQIASA